MNENNVLKFKRPKPKQDDKPKVPGPKKGQLWLAVVIFIILVWAYYQFLAPQSV